jgi:hypothetical protein
LVVHEPYLRSDRSWHGNGSRRRCHARSRDVTNLFNLFALAIRQKLGAAAPKETIFAYPTSASDIGYML